MIQQEIAPGKVEAALFWQRAEIYPAFLGEMFECPTKGKLFFGCFTHRPFLTLLFNHERFTLIIP